MPLFTDLGQARKRPLRSRPSQKNACQHIKTAVSRETVAKKRRPINGNDHLAQDIRKKRSPENINVFRAQANVSGETAIFMRAQRLSNGQEGPLGLRKLKFEYFNSNFNRRPRPKNMHMKMQKSGLLCATLSSRLLEARNGDSLGRSGLFRASSGMSARQSRSKRLFSCFCKAKVDDSLGRN